VFAYLPSPALSQPSTLLGDVGNQNRVDSSRYQWSPFYPGGTVPLALQQPGLPLGSFAPFYWYVEESLRSRAHLDDFDPTIKQWLDQRAELGMPSHRVVSSKGPGDDRLRERISRLVLDLDISGDHADAFTEGSSAIIRVRVQDDDTVRDVIRRARDALNQGNYDKAVSDLGAALETHVEDGRLWFVFGFALYKRGDDEEAVEALRTAEELGYKRPGLYQTLGDALVALGHYDEALKALRRGPDSGRNALARAMALSQLERYDEALEAAGLALQRDSDLAAEANLLMATIHSRLGNREAAQARANQGREEIAAREAAGQPVAPQLDQAAGQLRGFLGREDPLEQHVAPHRRWQDTKDCDVSVTPLLSLTTNDAYQQGGGFELVYGASVNAWRRLLGDQNCGLTAIGNADTQLYTGGSESNDLLASAMLDAYRQTGCLSYGSSVAYRYMHVGGFPFGHLLSVQARVALAERPWTQTGLSYQFDQREYEFFVARQEDRDGSLHQLTLAQDFFMTRWQLGDLHRDSNQELPMVLTPYLQWGRENAQGLSSKNGFWGVGVNARYPITARTQLTGGVGYRVRDFDNPDIRAAFLTSRDDLIWTAQVGLNARLTDRAQLAAGWQWMNLDSDVDAYDFDQSQLGLSIILRP